jgi:hypothetical protein
MAYTIEHTKQETGVLTGLFLKVIGMACMIAAIGVWMGSLATFGAFSNIITLGMSIGFGFIGVLVWSR